MEDGNHGYWYQKSIREPEEYVMTLGRGKIEAGVQGSGIRAGRTKAVNC